MSAGSARAAFAPLGRLRSPGSSLFARRPAGRARRFARLLAALLALVLGCAAPLFAQKDDSGAGDGAKPAAKSDAKKDDSGGDKAKSDKSDAKSDSGDNGGDKAGTKSSDDGGDSVVIEQGSDDSKAAATSSSSKRSNSASDNGGGGDSSNGDQNAADQPAAEAPADPAQLFAEANAAQSAGDAAGAADKLRQVVKLKPTSAESWWLLGNLDETLKQPQEAMDAFTKASQLLPVNDPRREQSARRAARLARNLRPHQALPEFVPIKHDWRFYLPTGPSLALGIIFLVVLAGLWLRKAREDRRAGPGSPAGELVAAAERLRRRDPVVAGQLIRRAQNGDLGRLKPADFALLLAAAADYDAAAREGLAKLMSEGQGQTQVWAARALSSQNDQPDPQAWVSMLTAAEPELRASAVAALERQPVSEAAAALRQLAAGDDALAIRATALLSRLPNPEADLVAIVTQAATPSVAAAALAALADRPTLPAQLAAPLASLLAESANGQAGVDRVRLIGVLARCGAPAADGLLDCLLEKDAKIRRAERQGPEGRPRARLLDGLRPREQNLRRVRLRRGDHRRLVRERGDGDEERHARLLQ